MNTLKQNVENNPVGDEILKSTETEVILHFMGKGGRLLLLLLARSFSVLMAITIFAGILDPETFGQRFSVDMFFSIPLTLLLWNIVDMPRVRVLLNKPTVGDLTIAKPKWWSIFVPWGPLFIERNKQIPLPASPIFFNENTATTTSLSYPGYLRTGPVTQYNVEIPVENSKTQLVWRGSDRNSSIELVMRINQAIRKFNMSKEVA